MVLYNNVKNRIINAVFKGDKVYLEIGVPNGSMISKEIDRTKWDAYLEDKLANGYVEKDNDVKKLNSAYEHPVLQMLAKISRQIVDEAYKLILVPTKDEINEARNLLVKLSNTNEVGSFNEILMDLFGLIPRKMRNPILFTAKDKESFAEVIDRENTLLDNLEIVTDSMEASGDKGGMIDFSDCTEEENRMVYEMLDNATKKKFSKVYKVSNRYSDNDFEKYVKEKSIKNTKLLFHGSRTENWFSIIKTGLSVSPINVVITGKMFGNGIYFAPKADKANGYTSLKGSRWAKGNTDTAYMGIFEVATGHEFLTDDWEHRYTEITAKNKKRFIGNCDSFHALAGKHLMNDEIIVYDKNAARIRYLVELKCK